MRKPAMPNIVCGLCPCQFNSADLLNDDQPCEICGHSLYEDHAALGASEVDLPWQDAADLRKVI
jgi:hypothetical protein